MPANIKHFKMSVTPTQLNDATNQTQKYIKLGTIRPGVVAFLYNIFIRKKKEFDVSYNRFWVSVHHFKTGSSTFLTYIAKSETGNFDKHNNMQRRLHGSWAFIKESDGVEILFYHNIDPFPIPPANSLPTGATVGEIELFLSFQDPDDADPTAIFVPAF